MGRNRPSSRVERTRRIRSINLRLSLATALLALTPALTGCSAFRSVATYLAVHKHSVLKTRPPDVVLSSSMAHLLQQVGDRYDAITSITSSRVDMNVCTGGGIEGEQSCTDFSGYIVIEKPEKITVILKLPVVGSQAMDMVSDGETFKIKIPPLNCAIVGSDTLTNSSQKGKYALRPGVILDSLLIRGIRSEQIVSMTQDSWTPPQPKSRKGIIEDPDYDIEFLSQPQGQSAQTLRVVHFDRVDLLPYRQDIYNAEGKVATTAFYSNYHKFGDINFPLKIEIRRPIDELNLTITLSSKTTVFNQPMESDQFDIELPNTYARYNMDDPAVAATVPCAAHAPQSPH